MQKAIVIGVLGLGTILLAILLTGCSDTENPAPTAGTVSDSSTTSQPGVTPEPTTRSATALTDQDELDEIPVGGSVEGTIEEDYESDLFFFQAEEGTEYLIEAVWETFRSISLTLIERNNEGFSSKGSVTAGQPLHREWTAPWSGKFELRVASTDDEGRGSYTVFVSIYTGPLSAPTNLRTAVEGDTVRVSWDPVEGADYYKIYHKVYRDAPRVVGSPGCSLRDDGIPRHCDEPASDETTYVHATPDRLNKNYYTVAACKRTQCSDVDSGNLVAAAGIFLAAPANVRYSLEGSTIQVSWDPVAGADYYNLYHDDHFDSNCSLFDGRPSFCDELAMNVVGTSYVHTEPDSRDNYYWVVTCREDWGCSYIDSENPATPIETVPAVPANVRHALEGSAIRVSWDPVAGADYYNLYHHDISDSSCSLYSGGTIACDELATNVVGTSYVHTELARRANYYWVVACNRGGCSEIDSENPIVAPGISSTGPQPVPTPTTTPSATAVPQSTPTSSSPTDRARFEDDTPPGYTAVALSDDGRVWGNPTKYTTDSDPGAVAYMLLGKLMGCGFANLEADRQSTVHIRVEQLRRLSGYESETVCRATSKSWDAWDGLRITHIRFFDESNEGGVREHEVAYSGDHDAPTQTQTATPSVAPAETPAPSVKPTETTSECAQRDKDVLVALYDAADGENWRRRGKWLTDEPLGKWYGVTTSDEGCVTRLELWRNGIAGELPAQLGSLSELTVLNLRDNPLSGQIPSEIGNLLNLELLDLSDQDGQLDPINALSGEIPAELGNLTNLRVLRLSFQRLSGHMPTQLGSLPNLESLKSLSHKSPSLIYAKTVMTISDFNTMHWCVIQLKISLFPRKRESTEGGLGRRLTSETGS